MTVAIVGEPIAIAGAGLIGASWAALFAHHGARVRVWDPAPASASPIAERVSHASDQLAEITPPEPRGSVDVVDDLGDAVRHCILVQESGPEAAEVKLELYRELEPMIDDDAIIASSTTALRWRDLAPVLDRPERFVTAHPFNPPHLMPLVEIYGIDDASVTTAEAIYSATDRVPVRLRRDAVGHIANRLAAALYREAVHIVADGIADVDAVDRALVAGPGLRWATIGVHLGYHLGGGDGGLAGYLEHLGPSQERRWDDLGSPRLDRPTIDLLVEQMDAATDGRSLADLRAERDALLIAAARHRTGGRPGEAPTTT